VDGQEQLRTGGRCGRPVNSNRAASGDGVPPPPPRFPASAFSLSLSLSLSVNLPAPAVNASEREIYCALRSIPVDWGECGIDFPPSAPTGARFPAHSYWRPLAGCRRPPDAIRA